MSLLSLPATRCSSFVRSWRLAGRLCVYGLAVAVSLAGSLVWAQDGQTPAEKELITVLRSDAPEADQALACKKLAVIGTADAVPDLAKLLANEHLSSWARIPLEVIPGPAADAALRQAGEKLSGNLLVGVINSIGVRRDAAAVEMLAKKLSAAEPAVAEAAAVALGKIDNAAATQALRAALAKVGQPAASSPQASALAEGCVLAAEKMLSSGRASEAAALYEEVRKAPVPPQRKREATRGAILARGDAGIPLLLEQLQSTDKGAVAMALSTARELPGKAVDGALGAALSRLPPSRAALVVAALEDRPKTVDIGLFLRLAQTSPKEVRLAAIAALGRVGNVTTVPLLLTLAVDGDADIAGAARASLGSIQGADIDQEIRGRLAGADTKLLPVLLDLVGHRRIAAIEAVLPALEHADAGVRAAALRALGQVVDLERLPILIEQVVKLRDPAEEADADKSLLEASVRMPDREACAEVLSGAYAKASATTQAKLLRVLGAVGGTKALDTIAGAARSADPELQDVSSRLLGEWMTADAAPVLLDLAATAPGEKFQTRALRGYIRIARQFILPVEERTAMCDKALAAAHQPAEQKMVIEVLRRFPSVDGLRLVAKAGTVEAVNPEARAAAAAIIKKLVDVPADLWTAVGPLGLTKATVEIVKATYGAGANQKDVTELVRKQVGGSNVILLPGAGFNAGLGGDPAPGEAKTLAIEYTLDGVAGTVAVPENAEILLPIAKAG